MFRTELGLAPLQQLVEQRHGLGELAAARVGDDGDGAILDELYDRIHTRVRTEPQRYRFRDLLTTTLFTRR